MTSKGIGPFCDESQDWNTTLPPHLCEFRGAVGLEIFWVFDWEGSLANESPSTVKVQH
jgi:hypothetical protein